MRGYLSLVGDNFRCNRCDVTIQEADLAEDLVVEGTYGRSLLEGGTYGRSLLEGGTYGRSLLDGGPCYEH